MSNWIKLCCCLLLITGCQPKPADNSSKVLYQQQGLLLSLSPAIALVETPLTLSIISEQPLEIISASLSGVSMYMGLIPLQFQKLNTDTVGEPEQWRADFLLGACSDPAMLWQLNVTLLMADGRKLSINEQFKSSW